MSIPCRTIAISAAILILSASADGAPPNTSGGRSATKATGSAEPPLVLAGKAERRANENEIREAATASDGLLAHIESERRVIAGKLQAEVEHALADARRRMSQEPEQAEQDLKVVLQSIDSAAELSAEFRSELRRQLQSAIRQARLATVEAAERRARGQEQAAIAREGERLRAALNSREDQLKQLMDRFDSLMGEGRWEVAADQVAPEVSRLAPGTSLASSAGTGGQLVRAFQEGAATRQSRNKNLLLALQQVEKSMIPFPDEPPIIYTSPDKWQELTARREKYKAVDLGGQSPAEKRILQELNKPATLEFVEQPLKDVVTYLQEQHGIPIVLATKKLDEASVSVDTPITKNLKGITLRSALRLMLKDLELTYLVRNEVLQITTPEDAESQLITKVYPVGDLVVPIRSGSNLFGLGGSGGLGGAGGIGGGGIGGGGYGGGGLGGGGGFGGGGFGGGGGGVF